MSKYNTLKVVFEPSVVIHTKLETAKTMRFHFKNGASYSMCLFLMNVLETTG